MLQWDIVMASRTLTCNWQFYKMTKADVTVITKSARNDVIPGSIGRPFGGVAAICKNNPLLNYAELESSLDNLVVIGAYDLSSGTSIHIIISVYVPYFKRGSSEQTEKFINTIASMQGIIDQYGINKISY